MKAQRTVVKVIAVIMALIGLPLAIIGALNGPSLVMTVLGIAFIFAAFLAYKSGVVYLDEQEREKENKK